ncbi:type II toxin-antitoxin system RelE/ParE family toxin [Phenylobacterium sp.]|uniref:type II toxin-antitoxin system RelE/ParE family toxin n=1 Tax=Phenylobacterium sp. TaxID=1871053 RepID=UPI0025CD136A|nr:type II toxin-antitoxin system RelE/ParE family toxin [Phenylobacterium sp.]MBX3482468.1 type II toxin-antitoxin system RelE/ParE family toxin [Phenylobacterium sp.]MCW5759882.1 type II toxin-antitoxin system RelE/ParE family toxin [Phenylobacterium sp.]
MTAKPINELRRAKQDIQDAVDHYLAGGATAAAHGFLDALLVVYEMISAHPASGSPSYAERFGGPPGLRGVPLQAFPYVVFYLEGPDRVDVVRVLHGRRDLPQLLQDA